MVVLVLILVSATIIGTGIKAKYVFYNNWYYAIPVFSLAIFCYIAQYTVPEIARGFAKEKPRMLPKAIITGMTITFLLLALVPMAAIGLTGPDKITEVVTIA